ncbi:MAG: pirin family protein [Alphaproteobacteria bacterium]
MIKVRHAEERGLTRLSWLESRHSFSFGDYHDPDQTGFRALRVINEDKVAPGRGFAPHSHKDMEIVTYMLAGALEHKDDAGSESVIAADEVQRMSAGTGITHSEYNHSKTEPAHLLQIWIRPEMRGLEPGYEQRAFPPSEKRDRLCLIACRDGREGALTVRQDVAIYASVLDRDKAVSHRLAPGRHAWLQVARGDLNVNGRRLRAGDAAAVSEQEVIEIASRSGAELLLFDLA